MATMYHAEHVGSLLRPPYLLQARESHEKGELTTARLRLEPVTPGLDVGPDSLTCLHLTQSDREPRLVGGTGSPMVGGGPG